MKRLSIIIVSIISIMLLIAGCASAVLYEGQYEGRVIDAETGQPLEGVVVLGVWYTVTISPAGGTHTYYDAKETLTDKNGEFKIQGLGPKMLSNVEPMNVQIFKTGYEDYGLGPWEGLKVGYLWSKRVKWEGKKAIIPLRKLTMEERRKNRPDIPPTDAPLKKIELMLKEINKNEIELGAEPYDIWGGEKVYEKNDLR